MGAILVGALGISMVGLSTDALPAKAATFGPSTMYTPPSAAPKLKVLYPRAIQLANNGASNGEMLATFEQYTTGKPVFPIFRSTDNGQNWSQVSSVQDTVNGWGLRYQPDLFELPGAVGSFPAGTILAAGNSIPNDSSATKLDVYASRDRGTTWAFVSSVATGGPPSVSDGGTSVWEPSFVYNNGRLSMFYSDSRDPNHSQKIVHQTTTNLTSWGSVVTDVAGAAYTDRPGMPVITKLSDGRFMMSYENVGAPEGFAAAYYRFSTDPESWANQPGQVMRTTDGGIVTSGPFVTWTPAGGPQGTIVLSGGSSGDLFLNTMGGAANTWTRVPSPTGAGYSRTLVALNDGRTVFVMNAGPLGGDNTVTYGAIDLGSTITSGSTYKLANRNSNLVLGVRSASMAAAAAVLQTTDNGAYDHNWRLERQPDGWWKIRNLNSGLVLGIASQSTANGAQALQATDNGAGDHLWDVVPYPGGGFAISNKVSGKRLEIGNASTAVGAAAQQWQYTASPCQAWILR